MLLDIFPLFTPKHIYDFSLRTYSEMEKSGREIDKSRQKSSTYEIKYTFHNI